jgi:hypothetical protein
VTYRTSTVTTVALALAVAGHAPATRGQATRGLLTAVFLGQAYEPSDFYVLGSDPGGGSAWPKRLTFRCMERNIRMADRTGEFVKEINASAPAPSGGAQPEESSSGIKPPTAVGFFGTIDRMEVTDSDIGHYTGTEPVSVPCPVVAFTDAVPLGALDFSQAGKRRPLSQREKLAVRQERARVANETKSVECTTEPGFIDRAEQLWSAKVTGSDLHIRLSTYEDPGCAGHLSAVYVIDLLRRGSLSDSREIRHYAGVL